MNTLKVRQRTAAEAARPKAGYLPPELHWRFYPSHEVLCFLDRLATAQLGRRRAAHRRKRAALYRRLAGAAFSVLCRYGSVHCVVFVWQGQRFALSSRLAERYPRWVVEVGLADHALPRLLAPPAKGRKSP